MEVVEVIDIAREALWATTLLAGPLLLIALATGLLVGIVQAATSINEMTLSFIPKLAALVAALALIGGWQVTVLVDFARRIFDRIPGLFA